MGNGMKKIGFRKLLPALLAVMTFWVFLDGFAFHVNTCGNSEEAIDTFLKRDGWDAEILKIEEKDRIKAVIYEREDIGTCYAVFEKKLFGLRLDYDGMDVLSEEGLRVGGGWHSGSLKGSKCDLIIYGDNRDGRIASYMLEDVPEIAREYLEWDYILDIYILDGIDHLPNCESLMQYTFEGTAF